MAHSSRTLFSLSAPRSFWQKSLFSTCVLSIVFAAGCRELPGLFEGERVLVRAGKSTLRVMDMEAVFPVGIEGADSVQWVENYIDRWVRDELKLAEARRLFGDEQADEELVEAYRNSLMLRRLEQHFITDGTGTELYSDKELHDYYDAHKGDFVLDRTIVKGRVVAFPSAFRQKVRLKELFAGTSDESRSDLGAMATKNGFALREMTEWTDYLEFLKLLPTRRNESYDYLLSRAGVQEMTDDGTTYWFVVSQARTPGSVSPYEMVSDMVRMAVSARRKSEILRAFEDSIYRQALTDKKVVINL